MGLAEPLYPHGAKQIGTGLARNSDVRRTRGPFPATIRGVFFGDQRSNRIEVARVGNIAPTHEALALSDPSNRSIDARR